MTSNDLSFLLGIAVGFGITLLIETVVVLIIFVLVRDKEADE